MSVKIKRAIEKLSPLETDELLSPHIDFCSNREVFIDGCNGIIEYNNETVRLNCKNYILKFTGNDLTVKAETIEQITLCGDIISLEFSNL